MHFLYACARFTENKLVATCHKIRLCGWLIKTAKDKTTAIHFPKNELKTMTTFVLVSKSPNPFKDDHFLMVRKSLNLFKDIDHIGSGKSIPKPVHIR